MSSSNHCWDCYPQGGGGAGTHYMKVTTYEAIWAVSRYLGILHHKDKMVMQLSYLYNRNA